MSNNIRYTSIIIENSNNIPKGQSDQIRYLANSHVWQTWGTGINSNLPLKTINAIENHNIVMSMSNMNVGIGTIKPLAKLHVEGQSYFTSNIGIGTTNPQQTLEVIGNVKATAFIGNGSFLTNVIAESQWTNNVPNIYFMSNVGIGTTNPQQKIDVIGNVKAIAFIGSGSLLTDITSSQWITNTSNIYFTSNVGIGTDNPLEKLDVIGNVKATAFIGSGSLLTDITSSQWTTINTSNIYCTSNIGIGTTLPIANLHVQGNALVTGDLTVSGSNIVNNQVVNNIEYNSSNVIINNLSGLGPALKVNQKGSGSNYPIADFYDNDVSTTIPALRIADGGNVGIGTTNPLVTLHVEGTIRATNQPMCSVFLQGTDGDIAQGVPYVKLPMTGIIYNPGGYYKLTSGTYYFLVPISGSYLINATVTSVAAGFARFTIYKNGNAISTYIGGSPNNLATGSITMIVLLAANDQIDLRSQGASAGYCGMTILLVG